MIQSMQQLKTFPHFGHRESIFPQKRADRDGDTRTHLRSTQINHIRDQSEYKRTTRHCII